MRRLGAIVLALAMAACGSDSPDASGTSVTAADPVSTVGETTAPGSSVVGSSAPTTTTTTISSSTAPPVTSTTALEPSEEDLAVFIAAMEELLLGTVYEGEAVNEPELFLSTAWLFCDWLDEGDTPDAVLTRYLDELAGGTDAATDDQLVLAGALLGAAVAVLCPGHTPGVG